MSTNSVVGWPRATELDYIELRCKMSAATYSQLQSCSKFWTALGLCICHGSRHYYCSGYVSIQATPLL